MVTAFRESFHDEATQPYRRWMDSYAIDFRGDGDRKLYPGDMVYWPLKRQRPLKLTMPTLTVQGPVGFPNAYKLSPMLLVAPAALRCWRAITEGVDDHGKGWRHLPPARVIEVIARKTRRPALEDTRKLAFSDVIAHQILRHVGDTVALNPSVDHWQGRVESQLPFHPHSQLASVFFKCQA